MKTISRTNLARTAALAWTCALLTISTVGGNGIEVVTSGPFMAADPEMLPGFVTLCAKVGKNRPHANLAGETACPIANAALALVAQAVSPACRDFFTASAPVSSGYVSGGARHEVGARRGRRAKTAW